MASIWDDIESGKPSLPPAETSTRSIWDEIESGPKAKTAPKSRNPFAVANDTVITAVNSGLGLAKSVSDFVSVDNPLSRGLQSIITEGEQNQSDLVKQSEGALNQAIDEGGWEAAKGVGKYIVTSPLQTAAKIVGNVGPIGRGVKTAVGAAELAGLGAKGATWAGRGAGAALSGAAGGGDAAADAYAQVMASPNVPQEQKELLARAAARDASVVPALIGAITGGTGMEAVMAGAGKQGIRKLAAKEAGSEFFEEGATKASANIAANQYDPTIDRSKGVFGSALMGSALGGIGGGGVAYLNNRSHTVNILGGANPTADDKLVQDTQPLLGIGYDPMAGNMITYPDGSVRPASEAINVTPSGVAALTPEDTLKARYTGYVPPVAAAPETETTTGEIADELTQAAEKYKLNLTSKKGTPIQQRIDLFTKAVDLVGNELLTPAQLGEVAAELKNNRYDAVEKTLAQIEADFQEKQRADKVGKAYRVPKEQQNVGTTVPTDTGVAPSVVAGGADLQGGVAPDGSNAAVTEGAGGVGGVAPIAPSSGPEVSLLGATTNQQAPVVTRKRRVVFNQPQQGTAYVAPETETTSAVTEEGIPAERVSNLSLEDQLALGELTGNDVEARAQLQEEQGQRVDDTTTDEQKAAAMNALLERRFATSKDAKRDAQIAAEYLATMKMASHGTKGEIANQIGQKYGISAAAVRKIGNTTDLVASGVAMGMTPQQALDLLEVADQSKTGINLSGEESPTAVADALRSAGMEPTEGENLGFGADESTLWKQGNAKEGIGDTANAAIEAQHNEIASVLDRIDSLEALISEQPSLEESLRPQVDAAMAQLQTVFKKVEAKQTQMAQESKVAEFGVDRANEVEAADVTQELTGDIYEKRSAVPMRDGEGNNFAAEETTLQDLLDHKGVVKAVAVLHKSGLSHTVKAIDAWYVTNDPVAWDAIYTTIDGERAIVFSSEALASDYDATIATLHEIGHAIEGLEDGGLYSGEPQFNLKFKDGKVSAMPKGDIVAELLRHTQEDPESPLALLMSYPLEDNEGMTADRVREELFAQLWAFTASDVGIKFLKDNNLPQAAAFMEKVHAEVKQTDYAKKQGAESGQVSTKPQAGGNVRQIRSGGGAAQANKESLLNSPAVKLLTEAVSATADKALNTVVFTEDLLSRAVKQGIKSADKILKIYRERAAMVGREEREVERIASLYNRIPDADRGTGAVSANRFVYDMTREAKWGFTPDWRAANAPKVTVDAAMGQRFRKLAPESQAWIREVFKHGDSMLANKKATLIEATNSEYDALIKHAQDKGDQGKVDKLTKAKAAQLKEYARLFSANEYQPYAPLRRFGDYVVVAKSPKYMAASPAEQAKLQKDPNEYHVSFAESRMSAIELRDQLAAQFKGGEVEYRAKEDAKNDMAGGLLSAFNKLRATVDSELNNYPSGEERTALIKTRELVSDLYLAALADASSRKSEMRRKGVAGEIDMLRSFATQGRADAQFLASAKYNSQSMEAFNEMRKQVRQGGDQAAKSDLFNEIWARHMQSMTYDASTWAEKTSRMTSLWMLATSPTYYIQNLTQPFLLSVPFMAGRHNYFKSAAALIKAYSQLGGLIKNSRVDEQFDFSNVPADVRKMISTLVDRQQIDIGMETELGKFQVAGESAAARGVNAVDRVLRTASQKVEAINRVSTAMAAYRMELAKTGNVQEAIDYASKVISQTHGDYTRLNAPRAFNTNAGKVALQFRKFQLIQLTLLTKLVHNSIKGETAEVRYAARKTLALTFAHTGALAGLVGMPGFAAIAYALNALGDAFGDDDKPTDVEMEAYNLLAEAYGEDMAQVIMRGVPTAAGLDLSGKVGMGNALSILPFTDMELSRKGVAEMGFGVLAGATGGMAMKIGDGLGDIKRGDYYRGTEKLLPKGLSDMMKAAREADEGVTRKNGDVLLSADEISAAQTFAKAIGLPLSEDTIRRMKTNALYEAKTSFDEKATSIKNDYVKAHKAGDSDAKLKAREDWRKLQDSRAAAGFARKPMSSLVEAPMQQRQRERQTTGGVQYNKDTKKFVTGMMGD